MTRSATCTSARTTAATWARATSNFPELFGALAEIGYEGTITFESFSSAVVDEDLSTILRIWRNVWTDGMDLAKQARQFMREQIEAAAKA